MRLVRIGFASAAIIAVVIFITGTTMAFGKTVTLFSPFSGRLVDVNGAPQAGIRITREWFWQSPEERGEDETVTAEDGSFSFGEVTGTSFSAMLLPVQPVIDQKIIAHTADGELELWRKSKLSFDRNSELDGRPLNMVCRIDKEPSPEGPVYGTCMEADR